MNRLRECLVVAGKEHQKFRFAIDERSSAAAEQRAGGIDRMHDSPAQCEERDLVELERERRELAHTITVRADHNATVHDSHGDFDELIAARIRASEHECGHVPVGCNDRVSAVNDVSTRTREARENESGGQCCTQQSDKRFNRQQNIGRESGSCDVAVPDRAERLNAEEVRTEEIAEHWRMSSETRTEQRAGSARQVRQREHSVDQNIERRNESKESSPAHAEQCVVGGERTLAPRSRELDVERAVAI